MAWWRYQGNTTGKRGCPLCDRKRQSLGGSGVNLQHDFPIRLTDAEVGAAEPAGSDSSHNYFEPKGRRPPRRNGGRSRIRQVLTQAGSHCLTATLGYDAPSGSLQIRTASSRHPTRRERTYYHINNEPVRQITQYREREVRERLRELTEAGYRSARHASSLGACRPQPGWPYLCRPSELR